MTIHASANKSTWAPVRSVPCASLTTASSSPPLPRLSRDPTQTMVLSPGAIGTLSLTQISHRSPAR